MTKEDFLKKEVEERLERLKKAGLYKSKMERKAMAVHNKNFRNLEARTPFDKDKIPPPPVESPELAAKRAYFKSALGKNKVKEKTHDETVEVPVVNRKPSTISPPTVEAPSSVDVSVLSERDSIPRPVPVELPELPAVPDLSRLPVASSVDAPVEKTVKKEKTIKPKKEKAKKKPLDFSKAFSSLGVETE